MRRRHIVDYLSLAVIWGLSFVLLLKVVASFGWVGAVAFRSLIASGVLLVIAVVSRRRDTPRVAAQTTAWGIT